MPKITINGVDRSTSYTPSQMGAIQILQIATDGEVGQGQLPLPDPAGTYEVYSGEPVLIEHGAETIIDGFAGATNRDRGEGAIAPRRAVGHTLLDENSRLFGFRAYRWERPAETTRARFLAFLAAFVPGLDTTWVLNTHVANMPKKSYTTENLFGELFQEITDLTGNTAFIENGRAHLHLPTQGIISTIAVTDVAWDYINTFPPKAETPHRAKDPYDLHNDILVKGPGGTTTVTDATSITRHDAGGLKHQKILEVDDKTAAARLAKGQATLAESKNERITYECDIGPLTAAQVNEIPPGCLMSVTSQVMGLTASTQRLAARTLTYHHPGKWYAHLEFGYPIRIRLRPPRIAVPAPFVPELVCQGGLYEITPSQHFTPYGDPGTADAEGLVVYATGSQFFEPKPGWLSQWGFPVYGGAGGDFAGDCTNSGLHFILIGSGTLVVNTASMAGTPRLMRVRVSHHVGVIDTTHEDYEFTAGAVITVVVPADAADDCLHAVTFNDGAGACGQPRWGWTGADWTSAPGVSNAPDPGQDVTESTVGDGATTAFQTNYPYQPNSLEVHVGGVAVVPTQVDPDTGTFNLPFAPASGTQVLITYRAADGTPTGAGNAHTPTPTAPVLPGAAPPTADYLVGTAQPGLSAEIVVGATPGGELGGTWAAPTVDPTHAGSTHLALGTTGSTAAAGDHDHPGGSGTHSESLTDGASNFIFAAGDIVTVVGVPD